MELIEPSIFTLSFSLRLTITGLSKSSVVFLKINKKIGWTIEKKIKRRFYGMLLATVARNSQ